MVRKKNTPKRAGVIQQEDPILKAVISLPQTQSTPDLTKSKRTLVDDTQDSPDRATKRSKIIPAQGVPENSLSLNSKVDSSRKRSRPDDEDDNSVDITGKRPKINSNTGLIHHSTEPEDVPSPQLTSNVNSAQEPSNGATSATQASATVPIVENLPPTIPAEVQHLQSRYDFTPMSILSSAKIEVKVRNVLYRVGNFTFADIKAKPGIVVLHAYASCAGKMVSIVEIAKGEIQKERGKWYQYSKLDGELRPLKVKQPKKEEGKTLGEWAKEKPITNLAAEVTSVAETPEDTMDKAKLAKAMAEYGDDDGTEEAFETMEPLKKGAPFFPDVKAEDKVRANPVMTIYFARVPVPGLKAVYG